ncbi:MAG: hypothetical protein KC613_06205, partial [Myxococcales bacterium]|nr:hypothetical protein [Myxococcales bacterium]
DAAQPDAGAPDAAQPDASAPDAAPVTKGEGPKGDEAAQPKRPKAPTSKAAKAPATAAAPVEVKIAPSAPATEPPRVVARRVGGFDVTPKENLTDQDRARAIFEYSKGKDAQKRGAPKAAQRFLVTALKLGLSGKDADDAQRRLKQLADQVNLEATEF